jgi:hypothetical protein
MEEKIRSKALGVLVLGVYFSYSTVYFVKRIFYRDFSRRNTSKNSCSFY